MDSFFGIGFPELVFILVIAGLVLGPHRMRYVARTLGRFVAQMQAVSRQFTRQLNAELDALDSPELKGAVDDMKALRQEVDDLRRQVRSMPQELTQEGRSELRKAAQEGRQAMQEGERAFKPVSRPPASETKEEAPPTADRDSNGGAPVSPPVPAPNSLPTPIDVPDDPE